MEIALSSGIYWHIKKTSNSYAQGQKYGNRKIIYPNDGEPEFNALSFYNLNIGLSFRIWAYCGAGAIFVLLIEFMWFGCGNEAIMFYLVVTVYHAKQVVKNSIYAGIIQLKRYAIVLKLSFRRILNM